MELNSKDRCYKETDVPCLFHASEDIRLYCMECQDAICVQCLLSSHQKHSVQSIDEAYGSLKEKVAYWHSDKESMFKTINKMKRNFEEKLKLIDDLETESQNELMKNEQIWKRKLTEEIENQRILIKDHFSENRKELHSLISEISFCENGIQNFCSNSESDSHIVRLYCNLKQCMTGDFLSKINISPLTLELSNKIECIPSLNISKSGRNSQGTQTFIVSLLEDDKLFYRKITMPNSKQNPVTKIVPTAGDSAWLIADRKLYYLNLSELKANITEHEVDDIAMLENGDLFILNRQSTFIHHMNKNGKSFHFTCTDPYTPLCMDFVLKSNNLMIWTSQKDIRHMTIFGLDGIKKKSFSLPASHSACSYMSATTTSNFTIIYDVEQTTGLRNYVYSYNIEPTSYKSFSGTFGCNPYLQFVCKGMCYDNEGSILVSDYMFNSVYKLDRNLQFKKILLDRNAGLECPTALAFKDGNLWVADAKCITIFKYKDMQ